MALRFPKIPKLYLCLFFMVLSIIVSTLLFSDRLPSVLLDQSEPTPGLRWIEVFEGKTLYVMGDSTVANGNFNWTKHPYGMDMEDGVQPSGRFSNGYTMADYVAIKIGTTIPKTYMPEEIQKKNRGINFASGGCGILGTTQLLENCRTLDVQILDLFNQRPSSADLENSLFFLSVGSNDFVHNPKLNATYLVSHFMRQIESLYNRGARLFLINNVGPIGCIPDKREQPTRDATLGKCNEGLNQNAEEYSKLLRDSLKKQKSGHLVNATIVLANSEKMLNQFLTKPAHYGFTAPVSQPCCGNWNPLAGIGGMFICGSTSVVCDKRTQFVFFDGAHITAKANRIFIDKCFSGFVCEEITT